MHSGSPEMREMRADQTGDLAIPCRSRAIPWRSLLIRPNQDDLETQADLGRWEHTTRDPAIWATGPGLETRVWSVVDLAIP